MQENNKPIALLCYDFFYPGFKAGGPIQSLTNLINVLQETFDCKVLTSAHDLYSDQVYEGVRVNEWNTVTVPGTARAIEVWYAENGKPALSDWKKIITQCKPEFIYLNGMYSYRFVLLPLLTKKLYKSCRLQVYVLSPRGMLQRGSMEGKFAKKKIYFSLIRLLGLMKGIRWHATNEEEEKDIRLNIHANATYIQIAANVPKKPVESLEKMEKNVGRLSIVYLSLIAEKKNLYFLLELIKKVGDRVSLDIYGPLKDPAYWQKCKALADTMPNVQYKGEVLPQNVQSTISKYHLLALPTKGENFGHALYESLSVGRPIVTSYFTPWNNLEEKGAGWNVDINSIDAASAVLNEIIAMGQEQFDQYCTNALQLAKEYYKPATYKQQYQKVFSK
ncbi:MAG: glycosyltransferase [Filimonas sp.]|nr:glycosyltransferase [Filimonas sp.]